METTLDGVRRIAALIDAMTDDDDTIIHAGHVTVTPTAARLTLFRQLDAVSEDGQVLERRMAHAQADLSWEQLEQFRGGAFTLCELTLEDLAHKLEEAAP